MHRFAILSATVFTFLLLATSHVQASPGNLDLSFGNGGRVSSPGFLASAIAIQPDSKIVAVGNRLERYDQFGSLDTSFGDGGVVTLHGGAVPGCFEPRFGDQCQFSPFYLTAVLAQSDGKIVTAGNGLIYVEEGMYDVWVFALTRYNTDGSLDASFGTAGRVITYGSAIEGGPRALAIQPDGKIVATGYKRDNSWDFLTARYYPSGLLDTTFGTGGLVTTSFADGHLGSDEAKDVAIQPDGKIVTAGRSKENGLFEYRSAIARYMPDGALDPTFGSGGRVLAASNDGGASAIAIQSDSKIIAIGGYLVRYNTDGTVDPSFNSTGGGSSVAIQTDGKIITGRSYSIDPTNGGIAVGRHNMDGSYDTSFGVNGIAGVYFIDNGSIVAANDVAIQSDGKIVVLGSHSYPSIAFGMFRFLGRGESRFTVTRSDDRNRDCVPGDCSLREAVNAANGSETNDTIDFASGLTTVTLTDQIAINNAGAMVISGLGANVLTIDGGPGTNRIFTTYSATVTISGVTLTGGNGTGGGVPSGYGGAMVVYDGSVTLDGVHVTGNMALQHAGGVDFQGDGNHRILNSTISDNYSGEQCGGFYIDGTLLIVNSTISGNRSVRDGGGFGTGDGRITTLRNVTITNNTASYGGGISNYHQRVTFANTIVAGNTALNGQRPEINAGYGPVTSGGGNLVGDSPGDSPNIGIAYQLTDIRDLSPLLGTLQNNGGTTPTHALSAKSPVIDKGLNALVDPLASALDQRGIGFPRIRNGDGDGTVAVDIGAFEVQLGRTGPTAFDFDGDGRADISVFRPGDRIWYLDRSQAGFYATEFGYANDKLVPADYDGDGKADIASFRDGTWYWLNSSNNIFNAKQFGLPGDIPVAADYTGDERDELAVYRGGTWYTLDLTNDQFKAVEFGLSSDKPVAADYDGDGRADQAVYRGGIWYLNRSTLGFNAIQFGLPDDRLVPADYDGDGMSDLAVYRHGLWYVLGSQAGNTTFQFGLSTDKPVPADYDGDGKTDVAVYRDGFWYIQRSTSGLTVHQFGLANDIPILER